ncbi:AAA ATPase forming ring-shaped complexes [Seminavis robusta]|uniref:Vesicle-fusing ATPase n=1 Tax=Seminavis robusta TaxID=568900 RepID=A0A9N8HH62_9STRA|nr:AAA ATPase forming ring-shaped complexes [Seminavis robusta]|eukprot:Sro521_g159270.1 AAA ATPase forming ring-shaped complexes (757) ;mRNA; r:14049-16319
MKTMAKQLLWRPWHGTLSILVSLLIISRVNSFCSWQPSFRHGSATHGFCSSKLLAVTNGAAAPTINTDITHGEATANGEQAKANSTSITTPWFERKDDVFMTVASNAANCLFQSDMKRDARQDKDGAVASGATNWIDDAAAFDLKNALDKVKLKLPDERTGLDRDEASSWIRWMKASPTPMIINLSEELRQLANQTLSPASLQLMDQTPTQFLQRLGCRLVILPSGAALDSPLTEAAGSMIYGKLLFGGVTRYRLLVSSSNNNYNNINRPARRTGERTVLKPSTKDDTPVWIQYGGPERMYEAVDMGAAALLEVVVMPLGQQLESVMGNNMVVGKIVWKPQQMFTSFMDPEDETAREDLDDNSNNNNQIHGYTPVSLSGKERNEAFQNDFQSSVGGLQPQIDAIVRRVLDGRIIRPAEDVSTAPGSVEEGDFTTQQLALASMEAEELALLGLTPVRGLLLYGPPGCGKTALAREISRSLRARAPKIVSAPELLDRWVGGSEKLVRALFADAEAELAACNGDATKSALHVIVIDEIDAVFRKRSTAEDSGEATRSSVVNQILAKLDGVNAIPNVLLIGMTNRRELLDDALLRPGRLEVQIEIPLPDKEGRREILQIHFDALRRKGRLSMPLCCAVDGVASSSSSLGDTTLQDSSSSPPETGDIGSETDDGPIKGRKRRAVKQAINKVFDTLPMSARNTFDLAADYATAGFSGADIAGLVRCAGSIALARARKDGNGIESLLITMEDVKQALDEVKKV